MRFEKPVSMVMVAYNEEDHIERVVKEYYEEIYEKLPEGSEFIIYLDCPTDRTPEIVRDLAEDIDITVVMGKENLGYAGAMTNGLKKAENDLVFYSDSSGKHQARDFWKLVKYVDNYPIVTGLRKPREDPVIRRIISFGQRIIISVLFAMPFHDTNTGYKIIWKDVLDDVLNDCKYMKQSFSSELLIRASKKGYDIKDVPVKFTSREKKNTGTSFSQLPSIAGKSLKGYLKLWKELIL